MTGPTDDTQETDIIIVGAGSAGAVLAARLSHDPRRRVHLLEAGRVYAPGAVPADLIDPARVPGAPEHDWGYTARGNDRNPGIAVPRGKAVGGSSSVGATIALRAAAHDIVSWNMHGIEGWLPEDVQATFLAMETPAEYGGSDGRSARLPVRQLAYGELTPSLRAFIDAGVEAGYTRISDFAAARRGGIGPSPLNIVAGERQSTAQRYLTEEIRCRPNLTIRGDTLIDRVAFVGLKAIGVMTADGELLESDQVILSAGAYGSAAILLRSGVGPARDLLALGIQVVADLPVGCHFVEQPCYRNAYALKPDHLDMRPAAGALLRTASSLAQPDELDIQVTATHLSAPAVSPTGGAVVLDVGLMTPESRGRLRLRSRDPREQPEIDCNLLAAERDRARLFEAVKRSRHIGRNSTFARCTAFELSPGAEVRDDADLAESVMATLTVCGNPVSSAPMGEGDVSAVVDSDGAVVGVEELRVIDASIIPEAPTVPANPTVIMIAERLAQRLYSDGDQSAAHRDPTHRWSLLWRLVGLP